MEVNTQPLPVVIEHLYGPIMAFSLVKSPRVG